MSKFAKKISIVEYDGYVLCKIVSKFSERRQGLVSYQFEKSISQLIFHVARQTACTLAVTLLHGICAFEFSFW